ncbi:MAG: glycosyltransferase family 4 protein, partial [Zavarzinia sp.]|nr:glycosyltransferase family 4 protein [Zavarzinia sp.]
MNVLLASVDALPQVGGISFMAHHVAAGLVRKGANVVFVGPAGSYVPRGFDRNYSFYEDVASNVALRAGEGCLVEDARIAALFKSMIERYRISRVVLMHPYYYGVGAIDACRAAGVPCTVFFHGLEIRCQIVQSDGPVNLKALARASGLTGLAERTFASIARADELAVNSVYTAEMLHDFDPGLSARVVGCGVDLDDIERRLAGVPLTRTGKAERRRGLGLPDRPTLAFIGRLVP